MKGVSGGISTRLIRLNKIGNCETPIPDTKQKGVLYMPVYTDCHLHSSHSGDSDASMESMIEKGIGLGLKQMCFTEHMDYDYPASDSDPEDKFLLNTDSYLYDLIRCKERYADRIKLLFGVELGLQPHLSGNNARYVHSHDFDFVIGSSHLVLSLIHI